MTESYSQIGGYSRGLGLSAGELLNELKLQLSF